MSSIRRTTSTRLGGSRLPYSDGLKNEIIIHRKGRVGYIFAVRQAGGKIVEIGDESGASEEELENAIGDKTVAVLYFANPNHDPGQVPVPRGIEITQGHGIPAIVDAAAQIPPIENRTPHVQVTRAFPSEAGRPMPRAELVLDEEALGLKRDRLLDRLLDGDPAIALAPSGEAGVYINPQTLEKGEIEIIIRWIGTILDTASRD